MIVLHCARVPDALDAPVAAAWLKQLPRARAAVLSRRLTAGSGLESLTGLALLAGCASAAGLPPLSQLTWSRRGKPACRDGPPFSPRHAVDTRPAPWRRRRRHRRRRRIWGACRAGRSGS
jgi:hypothetical protein